jgi:RNA polymerase sigma-70 factor, ECF subfamily
VLEAATSADRVREFQSACADDAAFGPWYDASAPRVYRFVAARCGGDHHLAEELTQQAMIQAIRSRSAYDGRASAVTWICAIARNLLIDHHRRLDREERGRLRLTVREIAPGDPQARVAERDEVESALRRLPAIGRLALVLRHIDDYSVPEVARLIGRTESATHALLTRSREQLRASLRGSDR